MFYRRIFCSLALLIIAQFSFAGGSSCISVATGNWSDSSTWNCGGVSLPADGSGVTIKPGHKVTLNIDTPDIGFLVVDVGGNFDVAASVNGLNLNISVNSGASAIDLSEASIELFGDFTINADDRNIKLGEVKGEFALTLNSSGETRFEGIVGNTSFSGAGSLTALTTDALGTTVFDIPNGGVNDRNFIVNGPRTFNDDVFIVKSTHIKGKPGPIIFNGTVNTDSSVGFQSLFFSFINNTTLQFNQNIGVIKNLGGLEISNSGGVITELNLSQLSVNGKIALSGSVVLNSPTENIFIENTSASINSLVGLGSNSGATIRTAAGVNPNSLVIDSPTNKVLIFAPVGDNSQPLNYFTIYTSNTITLDTPSITTTASQGYTGNILMAQDMSLNASELAIQSNIDNAGFALTIANSDQIFTSSIVGVLSGSGDLMKTGLGGLGFSSQASMTGNVSLNEGSLTNNAGVNNLFVNSSVITLASGTTAHIGTGTAKDVDLSSNQQLKGGGGCNCTVNVMAGVVSPGLNSGQVTNHLSMNSMKMNALSTLSIELNGTDAGESYDQILVDDATLTDGLLNLSLGFAPAIGDTFIIIKVFGPAPAIGGFNGLLEGDTININNNIFSISYSGGDSNDVELTVLSIPRLYVDADSIAVIMDGLSWATAFDKLQDALTVSISGDEIWVADGVYYPDEGAAQVNNERSSSFELSSVDIYGGFDGTETALGQRNFSQHITILSGDIDGNDSNSDGNFIAESTDDIQGLNAYHVITISGDDNRIDGIVITAGQALEIVTKSQNNIRQKGGNPNELGAGMLGNNFATNISNVQFVGNIANEAGGAIYDCNACIIFSSDFYNNKALNGSGGAISFCSNCNISDSEFMGNQASGSSGAMRVSGIINNVLFENNHAGTHGGAVVNTSSLQLNHVKFINNSSGSIGGALRSFQSVVIGNSLFSGNQSDGDGGAIYNSNTMTITNSTLTGNQSSTGVGGAIFLVNTVNRTIDNSIIWNNQDSSGIGTISASVKITDASLTTTNSIIQGSGGSSNWDSSASTDGGNNLDLDPMFILETDPTIAQTNIGNAHLTIGSPAIDAGDDSLSSSNTDLDGLIRISGSAIDMGAYEFFEENVFSDGFE